jgi:hypothetical protein
VVVSGAEVKVDLRPISAVFPHEETTPELTAKLTQAILRDAVQRDPIIVDATTGTILDGMHRRRSLQEIGARNIVCHLVDYSSPRIVLQRWIRVLRRTSEGLLLPLLDSVGIDRAVSTEEAFDQVEGVGKSVAILTQGKCYVPQRALRSVAECYELVKKVDIVSSRFGWKQDFVDEEYLDVELSSRTNVVVLAPKLTKQDVLQAARTGKLLPHKTTMHLIDLRPLGVDYPLLELKKERPSKEMLTDKLRTSRVSLKTPPYTHLGRTYKERVMVLEKG